MAMITKIRHRIYTLVGIAFMFIFVVACGANVYESFTSKNTDRHLMAEARILIDKKKYDEAIDILEKVENNSNDKAILTAGAKLGKSGLSMWELLLEVVDGIQSGNSSGSGIEQVFNSFSDSLFGVGEERTERLAALEEAIDLLKSAPEQDGKIEGFRCFLTGILVLPIVNDSAKNMVTATNALTSLQDSITGSGSSRDECPGLTDFETAMASMNNMQSSLSIILDATESCSILKSLQDASGLNEVSQMIDKFVAGADQGCPQITCDNPACQALQLGCMQEVLNTTSEAAQPNNGQLATCELVYNCRTAGTCF